MISKPTTEPAVRAEKVWRYLKFSRFVKKRQLWLSRADLLGDPWEITLASDQRLHFGLQAAGADSAIKAT